MRVDAYRWSVSAGILRQAPNVERFTERPGELAALSGSLTMGPNERQADGVM